jgi:hypothetical protein
MKWDGDGDYHTDAEGRARALCVVASQSGYREKGKLGQTIAHHVNVWVHVLDLGRQERIGHKAGEKPVAFGWQFC